VNRPDFRRKKDREIMERDVTITTPPKKKKKNISAEGLLDWGSKKRNVEVENNFLNGDR